MEKEIRAFLKNIPELIALFEHLKETLFGRKDPISISVQKTQIVYRSRKSFAYICFPSDQWKIARICTSFCHLDWIIWFPAQELLKRWKFVRIEGTHHVIISKCAEIDEEILNWLDQAFQFSLRWVSIFLKAEKIKRGDAFFILPANWGFGDPEGDR